MSSTVVVQFQVLQLKSDALSLYPVGGMLVYPSVEALCLLALRHCIRQSQRCLFVSNTRNLLMFESCYLIHMKRKITTSCYANSVDIASRGRFYSQYAYNCACLSSLLMTLPRLLAGVVIFI